jgi:hypothetical protein
MRHLGAIRSVADALIDHRELDEREFLVLVRPSMGQLHRSEIVERLAVGGSSDKEPAVSKTAAASSDCGGFLWLR